MDALLIDRWLGPEPSLAVVDAAAIGVAEARVREVGAAVGLPAAAIDAMVAVTRELGRNQLSHAGEGRIAVRALRRGGVAGLEIAAADAGPGIAGVAAALAGRPAAGGETGIGLAGALRLSDELDVDVRRGEGTCVRARKLASPLPRSEVGVVGRPRPGERVSGDQAAALRCGEALLLAVVDGVGHGAAARRASDAAIDAVLRGGSSDLVGLLGRADAAMARTRGAVMAVALAGDADGELEVAALGNVLTYLWSPQKVRALAGTPHVMDGARPLPRRLAPERRPRSRGDVVVMVTDGIRTPLALADSPDLLREHPAVIAEALLDRSGRDDDDATVLVSR